MKYGMFESHLEAIGFLIAGAAVSGVIIWGGVLWLIWIVI